MQKVKPKTKEHLIDYLIKHISLGTYDRRFLDNVVTTNIILHKPVTSNQAELLDTITKRYHRQLAKQEIDSREMISLPWNLAPIPSLPQFTQAHISIEDDNVVLKSPYKKDFVKKLKELELMSWHKDTRVWTAPANELSLKSVMDLTESFYQDVNYCPVVKEIIDTLAEYEEVKYWDPTLVRLNGNLYIVSCNQHVMEAIKDLDIDTSLSCLARLVYLGVAISNDILVELYNESTDGDEAVKQLAFAIEASPLIEMSNIEILMKRLESIGTDMVVLTGWYVSDKSRLMEIANNLKANKIQHVILKRSDELDESIDFRKYKMPVTIELGISSVENLHYLAKTIRLVNSKPIKINEAV